MLLPLSPLLRNFSKAIMRDLKELWIPIYGSGRNVRDWIFVEDHCEAVAAVLERGEPGSVYNISSENDFDNLTVVKRMLGLGELLI